MKQEEYYELVKESKRINPTWRLGQCYFNVLFDVRPDLSEQIRGTPLDPFYSSQYDKQRLDNFHQWLFQNWNKS